MSNLLSCAFTLRVKSLSACVEITQVCLRFEIFTDFLISKYNFGPPCRSQGNIFLTSEKAGETPIEE
jgi:hypothetical protein